MKKFLSIGALWLFTLIPLFAHHRLSSPDGRYTFVADGLTYTITFEGQIMVEGSLGICIDNRLNESALAVPRGENDDWSSDLQLTGEERCSMDTTWVPYYGENASIRDHYNQLTLHYEKGVAEHAESAGETADGTYDKRKYYAMDIIVRAYDEGIAFRYHLPETRNNLFLHLIGERTSFRFPEGAAAWYEEWAQGPYDRRPLKGEWLEAERPLLLYLPTPDAEEGKGLYVALLEAALKDYARGKFVLKQENELQVKLYGNVDIITPYETPWRVVMAGKRAVDLINNKELVLNLSPQPDFSLDTLDQHDAQKEKWKWVRPGRAFRSTRLDKASIFRSIDFCAQFGIEYVELDAGWYGPEGKMESDARRVSPERDFTMQEVCAYAQSKGVGVWLYVNQRALARQIDELLPLYHQWGVKGIKFGFVQVGSQHWTAWLHQAVAKCAEYELMVDIHDEYRPTGLSRSLPNLLTQEGIRGNEEMPDATHNTLLPFTRFLCGSGDYTLCYFDRRLKTTRAHQLAMAAVYYSPLQFLFWYDLPFTDGWDSEELDFWRNCPTVFDESIALDGRPGEFIIQARRRGNDWYVGALNNNEARTVQVPTDFLPKGKYAVEIYHDDLTTDSPAKVAVRRLTIDVNSPQDDDKTITLQLQPSGGAALYFKADSQDID